jgi:hypothetical protein
VVWGADPLGHWPGWLHDTMVGFYIKRLDRNPQ